MMTMTSPATDVPAKSSCGWGASLISAAPETIDIEADCHPKPRQEQ